MPDPVRLAELTTLRLGGPPRRLVTATTTEELVAAVTSADDAGEPVLLVAGGSNLVVADDGFDGTVVRIATRGVRVESDTCGGAMVTASHNPVQYNGFKISKIAARPVGMATGLDEVRRYAALVNREKLVPAAGRREGRDLWDAYTAHVLRFLDPDLRSGRPSRPTPAPRRAHGHHRCPGRGRPRG